MIKIHIHFICLTLLLIACDSSNHIRTYRLSKEKVNNSIPTFKGQETKTSGLTWKKPTAWIPSEGSSMRLASFTVPSSGGPGDLSVIQLDGTGGGLESNVNRWRNQLNLEPLSLIAIEDTMITKKGKLGDYSIIQIINEKLDSAFLCAIIPNNKATIFVKLSLRPMGMSDVVDDFIVFCSSLTISN